MRRECGRAADLLAAATGSPVPQLQDEELLKHAEACESCREMMTVVLALRAERDRLRRAAAVPSAGFVWWRAQLRARQQAALKAAAPVTFVHAAALVAVVVLAVVLASATARTFGMPTFAHYVPAVPSWADLSGAIAIESPLLRYGLMLGGSAWLILGPVALYFALRKE